MTPNITMNVVGTKLVLEIDLSADYGLSTSGKTTIVASSQGNTAIPGVPGVMLGLNVFKK